MKVVFADTSYWIALVNPRDSLSEKAQQLTQKLISSKVVTSEIVFGELLNTFSRHNSLLKEASISLIDRAYESPNIAVISQDTELFKAALNLYRKRLDQAWSYVDCSSFVIMKQKKILEALTYDRHFEQAGFIALLRQN